MRLDANSITDLFDEFTLSRLPVDVAENYCLRMEERGGNIDFPPREISPKLSTLDKIFAKHGFYNVRRVIDDK